MDKVEQKVSSIDAQLSQLQEAMDCLLAKLKQVLASDGGAGRLVTAGQ